MFFFPAAQAGFRRDYSKIPPGRILLLEWSRKEKGANNDETITTFNEKVVDDETKHCQIIHFNRVFHYKSSILGYHYFWKHPYPGRPEPIAYRSLISETY